MEALGRLIALEGAVVTGSDSNIGRGHRSENIHKDIDLVVMNGAIADDNVEYLRAKELGLKIIDRSDLLSHVESSYTHRIAIAGTHGKSTTTAMIGAVLQKGGLDPTVHNGARPNLVVGGKDFFVTEACEFKRSFLKLNPTVAVITNIDADHMDCYRDLDEIRAAFDKFSEKAGTIITSEDNIKCMEYTPGYFSFKVSRTEIRLAVPGRHNVTNAMLAVRVGMHFGVRLKDIKHALENFSGVERRFQATGMLGEKTRVIVDYAHHPAEIQTTIDTANRIFGHKKYLIVFQPHTFTRTVALFDDFVRVLKSADCVLYKTFSARERAIKGGTAGDLAREVGCQYFSTKQALCDFINQTRADYDAVILTGAGDINKVLD